jgi:hypothetical protein
MILRRISESNDFKGGIWHVSFLIYRHANFTVLYFLHSPVFLNGPYRLLLMTCGNSVKRTGEVRCTFRNSEFDISGSQGGEYKDVCRDVAPCDLVVYRLFIGASCLRSSELLTDYLKQQLRRQPSLLLVFYLSLQQPSL